MAGQGGLRVGVFLPDARHSWQTALALQEAGQLAWYATAAPARPARWPDRLARLLLRPLVRPGPREAPARPPPFIETGLVRPIELGGGLDIDPSVPGGDLIGARLRRRADERFGEEIARLTQREPVDVLWAYDDAALETFRWAKPRGIRCVLDRTTVHPAYRNRALAKEYRLHPNFFVWPHQPIDAAAIARQDEEMALADLVVVGSEFCAQTLRDHGCAPEKIRVAPHGYDETAFPDTMPERLPPVNRPTRFLFAGPLSPGQGIAYLFEAFLAIAPEQASITLVGPLQIPRTTFARYAGRVTHLPQAAPAELIGLLLAADCFVCPSLFEDAEAMLSPALGAGLALIQSANSDIPTVHGRNGIVLAQVSTETLRQAIEQALQSPERLATWARESWQMRPERSWNTYRRLIRRLVAAA